MRFARLARESMKPIQRRERGVVACADEADGVSEERGEGEGEKEDDETGEGGEDVGVRGGKGEVFH